MVKFALIGAGFIANMHVDAIKQIEGAEITAISDKVEEKGRKLAESCNAEYYSNIDELLKNVDIDCIDICVPTFLHEEMVIKVAAAKKHILCEKPLTLSLEAADNMIKAVKENGVKAMVGHALRFWPEYMSIKEYLDSNALGRPLQAFCQRLAVTPDWHQGNWGESEKFGGGAALDLHIHDLDYLIWLFGRPSIVMAQGMYDPVFKEAGGLVHIATTIEFENKVSAIAEGGWAFKGAFPFTMAIRILCEKGTIEWIFKAGKNIEKRSEKAEIVVYKNDGTIEKLESSADDAYFLEISYLVDCIKNDRNIEKASFEDGRKSLELALAAIKSAKEHCVVRL
ncbi:MAG: Gfo/Idh/MocA family oxidoreductase [Candidatus Humimicrobiaceae bacterium]